MKSENALLYGVYLTFIARTHDTNPTRSSTSNKSATLPSGHSDSSRSAGRWYGAWRSVILLCLVCGAWPAQPKQVEDKSHWARLDWTPHRDLRRDISHIPYKKKKRFESAVNAILTHLTKAFHHLAQEKISSNWFSKAGAEKIPGMFNVILEKTLSRTYPVSRLLMKNRRNPHNEPSPRPTAEKYLPCLRKSCAEGRSQHT